MDHQALPATASSTDRSAAFIAFVLCTLLSFTTSAYGQSRAANVPVLRASIQMDQGRVVSIGQDVVVDVSGLRPGAGYELRVGIDRPAADLASAVSFARVQADETGTIRNLTVWFDTGIIGCGPASPATDE